MIEISNLTKVFKNKNREEVVANDDISLSIKEGEIVGLLGHNGAGKTTMINQILGLVKSSSGSITVLGESIVENPEKGRYLCSVQPQGQLSLGELTPRKAVVTMGLMRGGDLSEVNKEAERLFKALDIAEWVDKESTQLSGGVKRLTSFCMAVIHSRKIIILDEPTNDVDPVRRRYLWNEIKRLTKQGKGVILVTHNVAEAENIVDRIVILHNGKVIANDSSSEILRKHNLNYGSNSLRFEYTSVKSVNELNVPNYVKDNVKQDDRYTCYIQEDNLSQMISWARKSIVQGNIYDYSVSETTLEDVYVKMTERRDLYAVSESV